ncbi:unnamed protein product [Closterium sp. NIES-64]|nr:unnamed protein product [Closterium sp. NIES-64]
MNIGTVALEAARAELAARFRLVTITSLLVLALRSSCHCPPADVYTQSLSLPRGTSMAAWRICRIFHSRFHSLDSFFPPPSSHSPVTCGCESAVFFHFHTSPPLLLPSSHLSSSPPLHPPLLLSSSPPLLLSSSPPLLLHLRLRRLNPSPLFPPPSPFLRSLLFHPSLSTSLSFSPLSPFPPLSFHLPLLFSALSFSTPLYLNLLSCSLLTALHTHPSSIPPSGSHQCNPISPGSHQCNPISPAQVPSFESTPSPFRSPLPFTPHPHHHQDHINATLSAQDNINATLSAQQGHNEEAAEALEKAIRALMVKVVEWESELTLELAQKAAEALEKALRALMGKSITASKSFCATCIRPLNCSLVPSFPCSCCRRPDTPANVAALDGDSEDGGDGGVGDSSGGGRGVTITGAQGGSESCKEEARGGDSAGGGGGVGEGGAGGGGGGGEEGGEREARKPACVDGTAEGRWVNYTWWEADECEYR